MSADVSSWPALLEQLLQGEALSAIQATQLMQAWLAEELTPVQTGGFLAGLRAKGLVAEELAAMAAVLREACPLPCPRPDLLMVDTCGTGGDGADTFNISTAVAFTAASCGVKVAKHGNRSASGKVGSADVLEGLGLNLKAPLRTVVDAITGTGVTFLFAPAWHPALVNLAPLRKSLGVRTVFNLLGPLVNPLRPQAQVLGVAKPDLLDPMAGALLRLGVDRSIVVHGAGGLDEASLAGDNDLRLIEGGEIVERLLRPEDLGLTSAPLETLRGGDQMVNQTILEAVLRGQGSAAQRDAVAFNTALVLWSSGLETDLGQAAAQAVAALDAGLPWQRLVELRKVLADGDGE
ncbi:MAG: Anthranilate phosphoribosyltransferase 2 [Synechococcus sp. CC9902]|nr:MAG: Anthranilate phosphoribosyltransferase 2 [Synechococcus sp. CC9902]|tara:strand:- start:3748 stop:4794 length:1047 start_codon:yes stop_codon:yes gene_type:complete